MVEINGLKFETSIGVLFALKEVRGHKTLQETYKSLATTDIDSILDILRISCEKGEKQSFTLDEFIQRASECQIGYIKLTRIFAQVVEKLMYDGLSDSEVEETKKLAMAKLQEK